MYIMPTILHDINKTFKNTHLTIPWVSGCSATTVSTLLPTGLLAKSTSSIAILGRLCESASALSAVVRFTPSDIYI